MAEQLPEPAEQSQELLAQPAVLHATITVTRAATGVVETYELIGHLPVDNKQEN
jgi:hypothetical protein